MDIILYLAILLFSVIIHEVSHGIVALWQGDDTAYRYGRLTLNPFPHLDLMGSVIFPAACILFHLPIFLGWAKPVPVNPNRFDHYRLGTLLVSFAGPLSNITLAFIVVMILRFVLHQQLDAAGMEFLPTLLVKAVYLNLALAVFNLLPIRPLDGGQITSVLLPPAIRQAYDNLTQHGFIVIMVLMYFGILGKIIMPPIQFLFNLMTSGMGRSVL